MTALHVSSVKLVHVGLGFNTHAVITRNGRIRTLCGLPRKGQEVHGYPDGTPTCIRCRRSLIASGVTLPRRQPHETWDHIARGSLLDGRDETGQSDG